ncbi:protein of unknown function [Taphrina deformans PYCC 5710]|uniref:Uncharacterized protein n=1 Tax=Taphrina deformans (strain PYCC 5710 / ATCC 11124 / CBS 356.35 / IMI 108563 / JCM 9778 / NBRC 8474) TaxID=1097556 RepID=R4XCP0_TAPDE|nr:protein of unknown function [Taphrina deformans PYCC 5710]|eukprot:CCG83608.1 protein of unknown function [Taphrina deformans PYCC 5710]
MGFAMNVKGMVAKYHSRSASNAAPTIQTLPKAGSNIYSGNIDHEMLSTTSFQSDTSSRKLAKILGPEVLLHSSTQSPDLSRRSSFSLRRNAESTRSIPQVDTRRNAIVAPEEWNVSGHDEKNILFDGDNDLPTTNDDDTIHITPVIGEEAKTKPLALSAPNSPDVDALSIAQFPSAEKPASDDPLEGLEPNRSLSLSRNGSIDFNEVCERLLDSLSSPVERPSYGRDKTCSSVSSVSSSQSISAVTEPPTPLLESSSSSCSSMIPADKMAKVKSDLVADQVALEAKFKLASARDALKRVKSNVACPDGFAFRRYAPPAPIRALTLESRTQSYTATDVIPVEPSRPIRLSRSYTAVDELTVEHATPRSSRSSRTHRELSVNPQKSEVRIGVAAPKNLNNLKKSNEQAAGKPVSNGHAKAKSKNISYIPQGHITSIHEVLA